MSSNANLDGYFPGMIQDNLYDMDTFDHETLEERLDQAVARGAETAVTYPCDALDIISEYEGQADVEDTGGTFSASEWQQAMTIYAGQVAYAILTQMADAALKEISGAADALADWLESVQNLECGPDELRIDRECPYGYAAHTEETPLGDLNLLVWSAGQIDGLNGVSAEVEGVWLSATWQPRGFGWDCSPAK